MTENGKYGNIDRILENNIKLKEIADELDCSLAQLSIAWILNNENINVVLLGASKVNQLEENIRAVKIAKELDFEIMDRVYNIHLFLYH